MLKSEITEYILKTRRNYFIEKVKAPLMSGLIGISGMAKTGNRILDYIRLFFSVLQVVKSTYRYPEPTMENTKKHNSHVILLIFADFFQHEKNVGRDPLFKALRRVSVNTYEHDDYYSDRGDRLLYRFVIAYLEGQWAPPHPWTPTMCWDDKEANVHLILAMDALSKRIDTSPKNLEDKKAWLEEQIQKYLAKESLVK